MKLFMQREPKGALAKHSKAIAHLQRIHKALSEDDMETARSHSGHLLRVLGQTTPAPSQPASPPYLAPGISHG